MKSKYLLFLLLALLGSTTLRAYDALVDGIYYNISGNEAEVTYKNKIVDDEGYEFIVSDYSGSVNIPSSIIWNGETYTVTSIGNLAFSCCSDLTSVTIPNSVRTIGWLSFSMCSGLTSVYIGDSVTTINGQAFAGCSSLSSITIPDNVTYIESDALTETAWYDNQPGGLVYAGKVAYKYKWSVPAGTEIVIRDGTIAIADFFLSDDDYDYHSCDGLTSVTIPNSVISIGWGAFSGCI